LLHTLRGWFSLHRTAVVGWTATAGVLVVWLLLMDWIVMPLYTHRGREQELPDITEHTFEDAARVLDEKGFKIIKDREKYDSNSPKGSVLFQNPPPYSRVKKGRRIYVTVSSGEMPAAVPNLVGSSERDAVFLLNRAGLIPGKVEYEFNDYYPPGAVCDQNEPAETEVRAKSMVDFTVSRGSIPSRFLVPGVVGKSLETAKKMIWEAGLQTGVIRYETRPDLVLGTVIDQDVPAGSEVGQGSPVGLVVSRSE
jgi:eukaryotic-like serine/threonine-protein kinase